MIIVNGLQLLTIITKCSILDGSAVLDLYLITVISFLHLSLNFISTICQAVLYIVCAEMTNTKITFALILKNSSPPK